MYRTLQRWVALSLVLLLAAGSLAFSSARAQDDTATTDGTFPLFGVTDDGTTETGFFQGTVSGLVATDDGGDLVLDGTVDGLLTLESETVRVTVQSFSSIVDPVVVGSTSGEGVTADDASPVADEGTGCDVLYLYIDAVTVDATGTDVLTAPITIDAANDAALGDLVCQLGTLLEESPDATADIVDLLNQIFGGVGGGDVVVEEGTPSATEDVTDEATEEGTEEATEEATVEDDETPTEEATEEATVDDDDEDDEEEPTKPVLTPEDDDGTPVD